MVRTIRASVLHGNKSAICLNNCPYPKQGQGGNTNRAQYTPRTAPLGRPTNQGALSGTGGGRLQNKLDFLHVPQDLEDSSDMVIGML